MTFVFYFLQCGGDTAEIRRQKYVVPSISDRLPVHEFL